MSNRERWVIYPLLFLAIGISMRNGVELQSNSQEIESQILRCRSLEVIGTDGKRRVSLGTTEHGDGILETATDDGIVQANLVATGGGGLLSLYDRPSHVVMRLGYH